MGREQTEKVVQQIERLRKQQPNLDVLMENQFKSITQKIFTEPQEQLAFYKQQIIDGNTSNLPENIFYVYNDQRKTHPGIPFSNIIPFLYLSRDIIVQIINFNDTDKIFQILVESCTIADRIWVYLAFGPDDNVNIL